MHPFEVLAEPVRRRILEVLAGGEASSGDVVAVIQAEFGISQPGVSQHLKVLRENGFATVRRQGSRRLYSVDPVPLLAVEAWLARFHPAAPSWTPHLDALATELARGRRRPKFTQSENHSRAEEMRDIS
jgi:DNA-binding transcriptional ArsR family regulator